MSRCKNKNHRKKKKMRPYGGVREQVWCHSCDGDKIIPIPNKKRARQESKKIIKRQNGD